MARSTSEVEAKEFIELTNKFVESITKQQAIDFLVKAGIYKEDNLTEEE